MEMHDGSIKLPADLVADLRSLARARDESLGRVMRDILRKAVQAGAPAKTPNRADEQLVARLQRLLAPDMASATGWDDIQTRLARYGFTLRPAGGGLTVHDLGSGERLCKSSELGFAYSRLVREFQGPMPGHPHRMPHLLKKTAVDAGGSDDRLDLFEPF
jgi:hypothetical protein